MGRASLTPISRLGIEAIAARIVHTAQRGKKAALFWPVAETPGLRVQLRALSLSFGGRGSS